MDLKHTKIEPDGSRTVRRSRVRFVPSSATAMAVGPLGTEGAWWILVMDEQGDIVRSECRGPFASQELAEDAQTASISARVDQPGTKVETTAAGQRLLARGRRSRRSTPR